MADEPKPPYVQFEVRSIEDREASLAEGHYVGRDVVFALVTPAGTRDRIEREATEWLKNIEEGVKQERIPGIWLTHYEKALENFKASRETPELGSPIINWPTASPAQIKLLLDINVRTVEELAAANEETVMRIGMGGRALKQKAQSWLDASRDQGTLAQELENLRVQNEQLLARDAEREQELKKLASQVEALKPAKEEA